MNSKETIGKGTIELVLLSLLSKEDMYGYQLTQSIKDLSGGMLSINSGALYTTLYKLEDEGCIKSDKRVVKTRKVRVYYKMTEKGKERRKELYTDYKKQQKALDHVITVS